MSFQCFQKLQNFVLLYSNRVVHIVLRSKTLNFDEIKQRRLMKGRGRKLFHFVASDVFVYIALMLDNTGY